MFPDQGSRLVVIQMRGFMPCVCHGSKLCRYFIWVLGVTEEVNFKFVVINMLKIRQEVERNYMQPEVTRKIADAQSTVWIENTVIEWGNA